MTRPVVPPVEPSGLRVLPYGEGALLAEVASTAAAMHLYAAVRAVSRDARRHPELEVVDVVPGARTVLFDGVVDPAGLRRWLEEWAARNRTVTAQPGPAAGTVELPTRYDGADLADVARRWDMTKQEAVRTHTATSFVVAFCGFAPGFAYCTGLPAELAVPRLSEPRPRVPAGSVAVADVLTGVYPSASPGGWRLLGTTAAVLWDPTAAHPAVLAPGTPVRFVAVPAAEVERQAR